MILADTSVWIDHLRAGDSELEQRLQGGEIMIHPFVVGELAMGGLRRRTLLEDLRLLPTALVAADDEVLAFIDRHSLYGAGIGYIDAHLLAAARLTPDVELWTRDRRLQSVARSLSLAASLG